MGVMTVHSLNVFLKIRFIQSWKDSFKSIPRQGVGADLGPCVPKVAAFPREATPPLLPLLALRHGPTQHTRWWWGHHPAPLLWPLFVPKQGDEELPWPGPGRPSLVRAEQAVTQRPPHCHQPLVTNCIYSQGFSSLRVLGRTNINRLSSSCCYVSTVSSSDQVGGFPHTHSFRAEL